jgi:hydrogenase expression/formation protein HypE
MTKKSRIPGRLPLPREPQSVGKISLQELIRLLPRGRPRSLLVGPQPGVDVGVVRLPGRFRLLVTTDPLYLPPELGDQRATWLAYHAVAGDMVTSGWPAQFMTLDLSLPIGTTPTTVRRLVQGLFREGRRWGTVPVAGHTGRYPGSHWPMVGSLTLLTVALEGTYVTSRDARAGHWVGVAGPLGLEAAVLVAYLREDLLGGKLSRRLLGNLRRRLRELTVLPLARLAVRKIGLGPRGISAMHDVAEGGIRRASWEFAQASRLRLDLKEDPWYFEPTVTGVLRKAGLDPLTSSSQGALLLAFDPHQYRSLRRAFARRGIPFQVAGRLLRGPPGLYEGGRKVPDPGIDSLGALLPSPGE